MNLGSIVKPALLVLGLTGLAYCVYKEYTKISEEKGNNNSKKEKKKINENNTPKTPEKENTTTNSEKVEKITSDSKKDIIRKMYESIEFNGEWNRDFIRVKSTKESIGSLDARNVIHVKRSSNNDLEFLFEIPIESYIKKDFKSPQWRDYVNGIKKFMDSHDYSCNESNLVGYHIISYNVKDRNESDKELYIQEAVPIDKKDCKRYERSGNSGEGLIDLAKSVYFSEKEKEIKDKQGSDDLYGDSNPRIEKLTIEYNGRGYSSEEIYNLKVKTPIIFYKVSFHRMELSDSMEFLSTAINDLVIKGERGSKAEVTYDHIIFHPHFNGSDNTDLMYLYTVDRISRTVISIKES